MAKKTPNNIKKLNLPSSAVFLFLYRHIMLNKKTKTQNELFLVYMFHYQGLTPFLLTYIFEIIYLIHYLFSQLVAPLSLKKHFSVLLSQFTSFKTFSG